MSEPTEQAVRRRAGWIGVEIGKSRVRTRGKPGFGLYRVRGQRLVRNDLASVGHETRYWRKAEWTGYLFTLAEIDRALTDAMDGPRATPAAPGGLHLQPAVPDGERDGLPHRVPTRWTSAYKGPRTGRETWGPINATGPTTVHGRRRAANREFQAEHAPRREAGLRARHDSKLRRDR